MQIPHQIQKELVDASYAFTLGAVMSVFYDAICFSRQICKRGALLISLEDVCYWGVFSYLYWKMIFDNMDGRFRIHIMLVTFTGAYAYRKIKKALKKFFKLDKINIKERFRRKGE